jgi:hypothetical protein
MNFDPACMHTDAPVDVHLRPGRKREDASCYSFEPGWRFGESGVVGIHDHYDDFEGKTVKRRVFIPYVNIEKIVQVV